MSAHGQADSRLRTHRNFRHLLLAQGSGLFGYQVAGVLIPLYAVRALHATPAEVGVLIGCEYIGYLLIGLPAGAWVDRWPADRVLVISSLLRGVAMAAIPVLSLCGVLSIGLLCACVFAASICTVFFGVGYQTIVPSIVGRTQLTAGNAMLEASRSIAEITGPSIAGFMMAWMPAQTGVLVTAACFFVSAGLFTAIRIPHQEPKAVRAAMLPQVWEGIQYVLRQPVFRGMVLRSSLYNFCNTATAAMFLLLLASDLRLSPSMIGVIFSGSGVGAAVGATCAVRLARRFGEGHVVVGACAVAGLASIWLPLARHGGSIVLAAAGYAVASGAILVSNILQLTVRQTLCPPQMLGRMNATMRFLIWGLIPLGASAAGLLAGELGIRTTLWLAVLGEIVSIVPLWFSPLRRLRLTVLSTEAGHYA